MIQSGTHECTCHQTISCYVTLCVGGSKASTGHIALLPGQYLDIARERGQYPDIAREGGFQLSFDPPFDPTFHL